MRIGLVTPRINGVGRIGDASGLLSSYLNSFMAGLASSVANGTAPDPSVVENALTVAVSQQCGNALTVEEQQQQCGDVSSQIAAAVAQYAEALASYQGNTRAAVQAGQVVMPSSYFTANPNVYSPYQNPAPAPVVTPPPAPAPTPAAVSSNALDRVTPQATNVTPAPVQNALSPPQTPAPVSSQNSGSFTGTQTTASNPGVLSGTVAVGGLNIPTWALLGAAALGLIMMVKGK